MGTETAGKQAVAVAHLHHIAGAYITYGQHAGHTLGPHIEVVLSVGAYYGFACGAAGGMDALYLAHRHSLQAKGILVSQVIFGGERQLGYVIYRLDVFGFHAQLVHLPLVEGHLLIAGLDGFSQSLALQGAHFFAAHAFHLRVVNHCVCMYWLKMGFGYCRFRISPCWRPRRSRRPLGWPPPQPHPCGRILR